MLKSIYKLMVKTDIKIAIIEDDEPIRAMYVLKLKKEGFEVDSAEDGQSGLKLIEHFKPDLILLDLKMPYMSGQEMLKKVRETNWGKDMLVVVLTNISQSEASMDLRLLRVEKYIVKAHYTPSQVVEIVNEVLKNYNKI